MYRIDVPVNAKGVLLNALEPLSTICEHFEALKRLDTAKTFVQQLWSDVYRLCQTNKVPTSLRGVVARFREELANAQAQAKWNLSALHV